MNIIVIIGGLTSFLRFNSIGVHLLFHLVLIRVILVSFQILTNFLPHNGCGEAQEQINYFHLVNRFYVWVGIHYPDCLAMLVVFEAEQDIVMPWIYRKPLVAPLEALHPLDGWKIEWLGFFLPETEDLLCYFPYESLLFVELNDSDLAENDEKYS